MWCGRPAPWITPNNPKQIALRMGNRAEGFVISAGLHRGQGRGAPPEPSAGRVRRPSGAAAAPPPGLRPIPPPPQAIPGSEHPASVPPPPRAIPGTPCTLPARPAENKNRPRHRQAPMRRSCRGQGLFSAPVVFRAAGRHGRRKAAAGKRFGRWQRRDWAALWPQAPSAVPPAGGKTALRRSPSCKCG